MAITTTESIKQYKGAPKCVACGFPAQISRRNGQGALVHAFDEDCGVGTPPVVDDGPAPAPGALTTVWGREVRAEPPKAPEV